MREFFTALNPGVGADEGAMCEEIIYIGDWPACGDALTNRSGLVYGMGIADNWMFEAAAGAMGFEVRGLVGPSCSCLGSATKCRHLGEYLIASPDGAMSVR